MSEADGLFGDLADQANTDPGESGLPAVRRRVAQRDQPEFQVVDLDSLLAVDHPARAGEPGRPPADPKILMSLWQYATIEAVGSARALEGLGTLQRLAQDGVRIRASAGVL